MRPSRHIALAGVLLAASLCLSCRKEAPAEEEKTLDVVFLGGTPAQENGIPLLPFRASYESIKVGLSGQDPSAGKTYVKSNASWLVVSEEILPADGMVALKTQANLSEGRREAILIFTDADNPLMPMSPANNFMWATGTTSTRPWKAPWPYGRACPYWTTPTWSDN